MALSAHGDVPMVERPFIVSGARVPACGGPFPTKAGEMPGDMPDAIVEVVAQHVDEAAHLRQMRSLFVRAPGKRLHQLARLDERLAAHLDGVRLAGICGARLAHEALERPGAGEVFVGA